VSEIGTGVTKEDLKQYFSQFGKVNKIKFVDNTKSGKNFAFLLFKSKSEVDKIMGD
jgi:RNA recognition motif-containing protein